MNFKKIMLLLGALMFCNAAGAATMDATIPMKLETISTLENDILILDTGLRALWQLVLPPVSKAQKSKIKKRQYKQATQILTN